MYNLPPFFPPTAVANLGNNFPGPLLKTEIKVLAIFPIFLIARIEPNIKSGESVSTEPGTTGILKNGVEIANYKSLDKIYFGPLSEFKILNQGRNFDVINLPTISIPSPGTGTTAIVQPVVKGSIKEVLVDQQHFDVEKVIKAHLNLYKYCFKI